MEYGANDLNLITKTKLFGARMVRLDAPARSSCFRQDSFLPQKNVIRMRKLFHQLRSSSLNESPTNKRVFRCSTLRSQRPQPPHAHQAIRCMDGPHRCPNAFILFPAGLVSQQRKNCTVCEGPLTATTFQSKRVADHETSVPLFYASPRNIVQGVSWLGTPRDSKCPCSWRGAAKCTTILVTQASGACRIASTDHPEGIHAIQRCPSAIRHRRLARHHRRGIHVRQRQNLCAGRRQLPHGAGAQG